MYLPIKHSVRKIINKHFPSFIADRFTIRMDSEIYIPKYDEGVWKAKKRGTEAIHILFDLVEIFEIPQSLSPAVAEREFLKEFKNCIENGLISIEKKKEWTDKKTAKQAKKDKKKKRRKALEEAFKQSLKGGD